MSEPALSAAAGGLMTAIAPVELRDGGDTTGVGRVERLISPSLDVLKRLYRSCRNLPDRILHRRRHTIARRRLAQLRRPRTILIVCHGNICRSPYLQAVLQRSLPEVVVESAGFIGSDRPVPELALVLSGERGFDLSRFRSRPVTGTVVAAADLVVVMDTMQARHLREVFNVPARKILIAGDLDPAAGETRAIEDPWQRSVDVFRLVFDRLDRCGATLTAVIRRTR